MTDEPHTEPQKSLPVFQPGIPTQGLPPWVLGLAFILTTLVSSFTGGWFAISGDVKDYFKGRNEIELRKTDVAIKRIEQQTICDNEGNLELSSLRSELSTLRNALIELNTELQNSLATEKEKTVDLESQVTDLSRSAKERKSK